MLAVVDDQHQVHAAELPGQGLEQWPVLLLTKAEDGRYCPGDPIGIAQGPQLHPPDAVGGAVHDLGGKLQGKAGLAHPAGSGQRHEPVVGG